MAAAIVVVVPFNEWPSERERERERSVKTLANCSSFTQNERQILRKNQVLFDLDFWTNQIWAPTTTTTTNRTTFESMMIDRRSLMAQFGRSFTFK